jgi:general stress protein 26
MTSATKKGTGSESVELLLAAASATMRKARYCWAITAAQDGRVNARPMGPQKPLTNEDPFGILFFTRRGSRKVLEIGRAGQITVVYQYDTDDSYLTLVGRGSFVADRALLRTCWQPRWSQYFPAGADDENAVFIEFEADRIELWVRGVTPEPFGTRAAILERESGRPWHLIQG